MHSKLTLRIESDLVEKAREWAGIHSISLSQAVGEYFARLPDPGSSRLSGLSPWTRSLLGAALASGDRPPKAGTSVDDDLRSDYLDFIAEKHR